MRFRKYMLIKYELEKYSSLSSNSLSVICTIKEVTRWGLISRIVNKTFDVPYGTDIKGFFGSKINVWQYR